MRCCTRCTAVATAVCAGCNTAYCGDQCQTLHWRDAHRFECIGGKTDKEALAALKLEHIEHQRNLRKNLEVFNRYLDERGYQEFYPIEFQNYLRYDMNKRFQAADEYRDSWTPLTKRRFDYLAQSPDMFDRGKSKVQLFEQYVRYVDGIYEDRDFASLFYAVKLDKFREYMVRWLSESK